MAEVRKKLVIIDGKSVFYRGYYAMPNLSTKDGTPTGGVYGFATMALEIIKRIGPDYVCVAWDKPKTNIRKRLEMYPKYKAGRKPPPADFYAQIPLLHRLLDTFGWPLYELDDYEADDIMGTLAVQAKQLNVETILITSDLDMLQLINGHVKVYALKKGLTNIEEFHPESFEAKYGIKVDQFIDLKALKGDSSDNIPGVPGIGEKGAVQLLKDHKTLDGIYENIELISGGTYKKLVDGKELAYLSKKLAEIWIDAPLKLDITHMDGSKSNKEAIIEILKEFEFKSLTRQAMEMFDIDPPSGDKSNLSTELILPKVTVVTNLEQISGLSSAKEVVLSSYCLGKHGSKPKYLLISDSAKSAFAIDLEELDGHKNEVLKHIFSNEVAKVGYDLKSTAKLALELAYEFKNVQHDVLIGSFLINSLRREQTFTELAHADVDNNIPELDQISPDEYLERANYTVAVIRSLYEQQKPELKSMPKVEELAETAEWPLIPVLAKMEHIGIKLNTKYLTDFATKLNDTISDLEQTIYGHADQEFNIASPSQLADILYVKLNLPTQFVKKGKTGYSTAANELAKLKDLHPIIDLISQYREVTKLKNTYVDTLPGMVDKNSRVHTTFNLTTAQTGRLSSLDPNLQNIPVRTELGRHIRTAFEADKGNVLISADYSQFELRLAAVLAEDEDMIAAFNEDQDIHTLTAASVLGIEPEKVTKQQRYEAKAVNFGILYGQGPHGLAEGTGMSFAAARDFIKRYFEVRPKLKDYMEKTRTQALEQGYVETLVGRRRPTPDVKSSNFMVREGAYRAAINMPVQGTAADLTKLAMIAIDHKLVDGCKQLLQIHDSILLECHEAEVEKYSKLLKETMENIYKLPVKLRVDISTGRNWGEL